MFLFKTTPGVQHHIQSIRNPDIPIGFIPTMGALHEGHESLIRHSIESGYYTVVSIYVNPTQFNDAEDLKKYPRPISKDLSYLYKMGCHVVFFPDDREIYSKNNPVVPDIDLRNLNKTLEAAFRPGHFEGVLQVVNRLLDIVRPNILIMGKKDLQQLTIIRHMIEELNLSVQLEGLPISRESDGLARSSRNERLSDENRKKAVVIYKALHATATNFNKSPLSDLKAKALKLMDHLPFQTEYFEFVRNDTMEIIHDKKEYSGPTTAVTAVWCNDVRLIDNMEMPEI